jgi:hypothetical protein
MRQKMYDTGAKERSKRRRKHTLMLTCILVDVDTRSGILTGRRYGGKTARMNRD